MQKSISEISILKNASLDGIECKSALFLNRKFPVHFHNEWRITVIKEGSELELIANQEFLISTGTVIITPPYVPHATLGLENSYWKYISLYIKIDFVKHVLNNNGADYNYFAQKPYIIMKDYNTANLIKNISESMDDNKKLENYITNVFNNLCADYKSNDCSTHDKHFKIEYLEEIKNILTNNFKDKIMLDDFCKKYKTNKFNILRKFKNYTGLTPWEYTISLRLEYAKQMILDCPSLTDLAFESGFYDQSHFNKYFKKYLGVSPSEYKRNLQYFTSRDIF